MCGFETAEVAAMSDFESNILTIWVIGGMLVAASQSDATGFIGRCFDTFVGLLLAIAVWFVVGAYGALAIMVLVLLAKIVRVYKAFRKCWNSLNVEDRKKQDC